MNNPQPTKYLRIAIDQQFNNLLKQIYPYIRGLPRFRYPPIIYGYFALNTLFLWYRDNSANVLTIITANDIMHQTSTEYVSQIYINANGDKNIYIVRDPRVNIVVNTVTGTRKNVQPARYNNEGNYINDSITSIAQLYYHNPYVFTYSFRAGICAIYRLLKQYVPTRGLKKNIMKMIFYFL